MLLAEESEFWQVFISVFFFAFSPQCLHLPSLNKPTQTETMGSLCLGVEWLTGESHIHLLFWPEWKSSLPLPMWGTGQESEPERPTHMLLQRVPGMSEVTPKRLSLFGGRDFAVGWTFASTLEGAPKGVGHLKFPGEDLLFRVPATFCS